MILCLRILLLVAFAFPGDSAAEPDILDNAYGMRFVQIPAGRYLMGLTDITEALMEVPETKPQELEDEVPPHLVFFPEPFYIGETEVTQQQWLAIMENRPGPQASWQRPDWQNLPVVSVSWYMAQRFVEELDKLDDRISYRLPTEAEWEYVARAGATDLRPVSILALPQYAWYQENSDGRVQPVATRRPNLYGVYDMLGNVEEWVADWYAPDTYTSGGGIRPTGPATGESKVHRGGSFRCPLHMVRPGCRSADSPDARSELIGFRVIAEPNR